MKQIFYFLILLTISSCASYQQNIQYIKENPNEITNFKLYLEKNYKINSFTRYETIWGTHDQTDKIISDFCSKNNIMSIVKLPKDNKVYNYDEGYYDKYGNVVVLYFNKTPLEKNQTIIFDYTEKGLENYDKKYAKSKIADRIYIFR